MGKLRDELSRQSQRLNALEELLSRPSLDVEREPYVMKATVFLNTREFDREQAELRLQKVLEDADLRLRLEGQGRSLSWEVK